MYFLLRIILVVNLHVRMPFLYLLLFFFFPLSLYAQQTGWQELTISDGLSQGMIFDLLQDQKGFIWVATKDGLNRYDGHNFKVFTHDPYNQYSISDNNCSALLLDSRGWIWVGTPNAGLNLFNRKTQRFYHIHIRSKTAAKAGNYAVDRIFEDPEGNIWATENGNTLIKITIPASLQKSFPDNALIATQSQTVQLPIALQSNNSISSNYLSFHKNGQALAIGELGSFSFNWKSPNQPVHYQPYTNELAGLNGLYNNLPQQSFIVAYGQKLVFQLHNQRKTIQLPTGNEAHLAVKAFDAKTLAIATDKFLWLMTPEELFRHDSLTAHNAFITLPPNLYAVTSLLRDQTGNIWVGTSGYGLRKFNPKVKQFHSSLPNNTLSYLYADRQNRVYVRHEFAYDQLNATGNQLKPFLSNNLSAADKRARYMIQDQKGIFWVSNTNFQTQQMSLFKFSTDWNLLKKYPLPPKTSFGFYHNQTVDDTMGNIWIGATNGKLLRFDPKTETYRVFSYQSLLPQKGADIETTALYFDQLGTLWIGTTAGLLRADHPLNNPTFSIYKNSTANRQSLSSNLVSSVIDDPYQPNRYLWIGTKGNGLDRLDKQTGLFDHITEAQGLPNKVVYGILSDEFNNLWLSTNRGLAQFNPKTQKSRNFTKADGLQDDEFNTGSFFKAPSGKLLFGGVHGLTTFRASDLIQSKNSAPQVNLIGLKINNETVTVGGPDGILNEGIDYIQRIDLSHTQNLLTLEFSVMDYANSAKNQYRYRLLGIDDNWVEAGTNRFANYAQLPTGHYTFQVMGSTDGQIWSQPTTLQVQVHPPFYRTWWAYLFYVVLLAAVVWQLYRFQTQRLLLEQRFAFEQQEASRLTELDGLKTQFFTNISHEIRTPLTLILGPIEQAVQDYAHDARFPLIQRNANRLLSLINQLLDLSKLEAGQLKAEPVPGDMATFFRVIGSSFESLAKSRQIDFVFEQSATEWWASFDRDKLEKIVTNLLSNALKFTPPGQQVRMTVQYPVDSVGGDMRFIIQDTGIGIAPDQLNHIFERFYQVDAKINRAYEGTGIGLALVNELVKVLNGTITVASTEGQGTTFIVTLPVTVTPAESTDFSEASGNHSPFLHVATQLPASVPAATRLPVSEDQPVLLVIDDNADIRTYIRSIFETDYQIIDAVDGEEGLQLATSTLPDIVMCDLMMPRLDGFGFCRVLKTQEATSHVPVIMLTAKATLADRIEGFGLGADDYITKPFNKDELTVRVRNLIQQRKRLYDRFRTSQPNETPEEQAPPLLTAEQQFIERLSAVVYQHIDNTAFSVEELAEAVHLSRVQLHRKLKAVANTTASQFIRDIRLAKAAQLLIDGELSVTQVAYAVGFDNLSYFAKVFQEQYHVLPSQYGKPNLPIPN